MTTLPIAEAKFEGMFWLIVIVVTIVTQIIKASKRGAVPPPASEPGPDEDEGYTAPDDELREFLESLAGAPPKPKPPAPRTAPPLVQPRPTVAPPPPPTPAPVQRRAASPPVRRAPAPAPRRAARPQPIPTVTAAQKPTALPSAEIRTIEVRGSARPRVSVLGKALVSQLREGNALHRAVLMREILGDPIALRKHHGPLAAQR